MEHEPDPPAEPPTLIGMLHGLIDDHGVPPGVMLNILGVVQEERGRHHDVEDEYAALTRRQAELLTGAVNALRGEPPELVMWSHHDVAELATAAVAERAQLIWAIRNLVGPAEDALRRLSGVDADTWDRLRAALTTAIHAADHAEKADR